MVVELQEAEAAILARKILGLEDLYLFKTYMCTCKNELLAHSNAPEDGHGRLQYAQQEAHNV